MTNLILLTTRQQEVLEMLNRARAWGFVGPADWPVGSGPLLAVLRWAS